MTKRSILLVISLVLMAAILSACSSQGSQVTLTLEEHELTSKPSLDPLTFTPKQGTQADVLAKNASLRADVFPVNPTTIDGNMAFQATLDGKPLVAELFYINNSSDSYVTVTRDGSEIYRISTGPASPVTSLVGLWTYAGPSWALETVLISSSGEPFATGQITIDSDLINKSLNYQEAFGFQTIDGLTFYFFQRDGKIGYVYDGQETMLGYDEIPHYNCCSDAETNPIQARNMVAFFARKGETWYYVELGSFK